MPLFFVCTLLFLKTLNCGKSWTVAVRSAIRFIARQWRLISLTRDKNLKGRRARALPGATGFDSPLRPIKSEQQVPQTRSNRAPKAAMTAPSEERAWQRMLSGRRLDLLDPSPLDIEIEDIAHGLARVARWNGQTQGPLPFSVAQHSVLVERFCVELRPGWPQEWRLAALLHDAPEFVIGDMISPFKAALGDDYKKIENRLQQAIHLRFGLPAELPENVEKLIKKADRASAFFEAVQFAGFSATEAKKLFSAPRGLTPVKISVVAAEKAQEMYLSRYSELTKTP